MATLTMIGDMLVVQGLDIDMDDVDIVLGYPWMDLVGTININVQNKFLKLWYKKKKITMQDIYLTKKQAL